MNLVENYLEEVLEVKECDEEWTKTKEWAKGNKWLRVKARWNCYGRKETCVKLYTVEQWEEIKRKGYELV